MKLAYLPFISFALFLFSSCESEDSENVNQDKIYASYVLEYNANDDVTYARSNFNFGNALGTKLELSDDANVKVNDDELTFKQVLAFYEKTYTGLLSKGDFVYTDVENNKFENTVEMVNAIAFEDLPATASRNSSLEVKWSGGAIEKGEIVTITIDGSGEQDIKVFVETGVGAESKILKASELKDLGLEDAKFYIRRSKDMPATDVTSAGGTVIARYDGKPQVVDITD